MPCDGKLTYSSRESSQRGCDGVQCADGARLGPEDRSGYSVPSYIICKDMTSLCREAIHVSLILESCICGS